MTHLVIMSLLHAEYGQDGHLYGFSPVWVRWCVERWSLRENTWRESKFKNKLWNVAILPSSKHLWAHHTTSRLLCEFSNLEQLSLGQIICIFVVHNKVKKEMPCFAKKIGVWKPLQRTWKFRFKHVSSPGRRLCKNTAWSQCEVSCAWISESKSWLKIPRTNRYIYKIDH